MVTKTSVVCWMFGIGGIITFICSLGMPILFAGQYMIVGIMVVVSAMYFNMKYKNITLIKRIHDDAAEDIKQDEL